MKGHWVRFGFLWCLGMLGVWGNRTVFGLEVISVPTISDLRTASASDKQIALVAGYWNPGDGGGGMFYRDASSAAAIDDGVAVNSTPGGRWIRLSQAAQSVNLRWYGVKGNGIDNDTAGIQAAVNRAVGQGKSLFVSHGNYKVTSAINITGNLRIIGENPEGTGSQFSASMTTAGQPVLNFTGSNLQVENVHLYDNLLNARGIYAEASSGNVSLKILNCAIFYFGNDGIYAKNVERVTIRQSLIWGPYNFVKPAPNTHSHGLGWTSRGVVLISDVMGRQINIFKNQITGWQYGVYIENGLGVVVEDNDFEFNFNGVRGHRTASGTSRNWRITRNWMEQNYCDRSPDPPAAGGYFTGTDLIYVLWNNHAADYDVFNGDGVINCR